MTALRRGPQGYLGDLALSWPAVVRQAHAFGHPEHVEAERLAVHGSYISWGGTTRPPPADWPALNRPALNRLG